MKEKLTELLSNSYAPYSNLAVACLIKTKNGRLYPGVNIENGTYKEGLCAEQNALANALTNGVSKKEIVAIYLMGNTANIIKPCFLCRQFISELLMPESLVICYNNLGEKEEYIVADLCPLPFNQDDLPEVNNEN